METHWENHMQHEIDIALEAEVTRRAMALGIDAHVPGERSRTARLAALLYAGANAWHRARIVRRLLRPLGPLALVAVASGAFAGQLHRAGGREGRHGVDDLGRFSTDQVFELARYVEQAAPEELQRVVDAGA
jgi:hypothetical protein